MKLLFLTQVLDWQDGVLGFVPRWIQGLAKHCEQVRVVALDVGDTRDLGDNVDTRVIGRRGKVGRYLRYKRVLREALGQDGFDTVLAHMVPRYALVAARPARRHGAGLYLWYTHKGVDQRLVRSASLVDKIFTASHESLRIETPKKVVTGHGIDLQHFQPRPSEASGPARLLSVGRLTPAKDPLTLLAAMAILVSRGVEIEVDFVGAGLTDTDEPYIRSVREQIELGGLGSRVHMKGEVSYLDVPAAFQRCTLYVNPSLTGSVDKVVLEAMACGRPVITCNESFPPILEPLGREAEWCTFAPGNAGELADRIEHWLRLRQDVRDSIGARLRELVVADHEVDRLMERLCREMARS